MRLLFFILLLVILPLSLEAKLRKVVQPGASVSDNIGETSKTFDFSKRNSSSSGECKGYTLTSCANDEIPYDRCSANPKFFKKCEKIGHFVYDRDNCLEAANDALHWQDKWNKCVPGKEFTPNQVTN